MQKMSTERGKERLILWKEKLGAMLEQAGWGLGFS